MDWVNSSCASFNKNQGSRKRRSRNFLWTNFFDGSKVRIVKRIFLLCLFGFWLQRTMLAQGTIGSADLILNINFTAISNSPANYLPSGTASYFSKAFFGSTTNTLDFVINTGANRSSDGWILQMQKDGSLIPVIEFTNELTGPFSHYHYSQSLQLTIDQIQTLLAGRWYAEVDFGSYKYLGNLAISSIRLPQPVIAVSPLSDFSNIGGNVVIAANNQKAKVVLDGSESNNPFYLPLQFVWMDGINLLGATTITTNILEVGTHQIILKMNSISSILSYSIESSVTLEIITPGEAVGIVISMIDQSNLANTKKRLLTKTLLAAVIYLDVNSVKLNSRQGKLNLLAGSSLDRKNMILAIRQLQIFQSQVRQAAPADSTDATSFINAAQQIIDAETMALR